MKILTAVLALALASVPAVAQVERVEQGRVDLNEAQNELAQARADFDKVDPETIPDDLQTRWAKVIEEARTGELALRRALTAADYIIANFDTIPPVEVVPPLPEASIPTMGLPKVDDGLDFAALTTTVSIPGTAAPDVVGAFRFICAPGHLAYNDPLVYPGQEGASHLHQFFGNLEADHNSTFESLRKSGESTCSSDLNRSAYWIPALLDGKGNVVTPDHAGVYYKRRPAADPWYEQYDNMPARLPRGLSYIFGWDATRASEPQDNHTGFRCIGNGKLYSGTMTEALAQCEAGARFLVQISAPGCWNGSDLTAPDYRSHTSYKVRNRMTGQTSCPQSHPYVLAAFKLILSYSVEAGDEPTQWMFASDHMVPEQYREPGYSFHADWFGAWNDDALDAWQDHCIDRLLNCSDFNMGDGTMAIKNEHDYRAPAIRERQRLVPIPAR